ncbi:hypothetical protein [Bacillus sp. SM2101]|uniref:hypothetical protein n=1 Tax=Bacillus sp. SM2101 TaxID=2805366 RepID=UPI001BDE2D49|nr:hypothetical protein [Bacillus sp. SM2101]
MIKIIIASMLTMSLIGGGLVYQKTDFAINDHKVTLSESEESQENPIQREDMENFDEIMKEQMAKFKGPNEESMYDLLNHTFENPDWTFESDDYNAMLFHGTKNSKGYYIFFYYQQEDINIILDGQSIRKTNEEFNEWLSEFSINNNQVTLSDTEESQENPIRREDMEDFDEIMKEQMAKFKGPNEESMYDLLNHTFENPDWTFESDDYNAMLFQGTQNGKEYYIFFYYQQEGINIILDGESIRKTNEEFNEWLSTELLL